MIKYKCWTCGTEMESPESTIGQRESCPKCGTPNEVPKPAETESNNGRELCYFCRRETAEPELASIVMAEQFVDKTSYSCRKCGTSWEEPAKSESTEQQVIYQPRCPSCQSEDVVPTQLPAMPVGRWYTRFYFGFEKSGNTFIPRFTGYICVPRCHKCKTIHNIIKKVSWALAIIVAYLAPFALLVILGNGDGAGNDSSSFSVEHIVGYIAMVLFSFLIVGLPVLFLTRFVLRRVIGKVTAPEKTAKAYSAVQSLRQRGWEHIQMCPGAALTNFIRSSWASQQAKSTDSS